MKYFHELQEGLYDPHIFKAFFLAGGPGSGKSEVVRQTTGGLGMKLVNSDNEFERLLKQAGLSMKMPKSEEEPRNVQRDKAKDLTKARQNTSQDVALQRNAMRDRSVPESIVIKSWKNVQANIGTFNQHFKGTMIIVDNNDPLETMAKDVFPKVWKIIRGLAKKKVVNTRAQNWISQETARINRKIR